MKLDKTFLWIKEYKHPLKVVGGIFFVLALIAGIFWVSGCEVEPIAFLLGLLSSLFLASPSVAEYFLPDRKPIKAMTYEEIMEFIPTTDPKADWQGISTDFISEYFLKEDPRLRFKTKFIDDGIHHDDFKEPWANKHSDPKAMSFWNYLYYDGSFLDRIVVVSIDGHRAILPLPNNSTKGISKYTYHVASIMDSTNTLDDYIKRSGLHVSDS